MQVQVLRLTWFGVAFALVSPASDAVTCDSLLAQIDSKLKAAGVERYSLRTVGAAEDGAGKVVGTCDLGARKIMYFQPGSSDGPPAGLQLPAGDRPRARPSTEPILTECKDGSASLGGDCKP